MIFHAKENITFVFYVELKHPPAHFLSRANFVNATERSSFYQLPALKKSFFASRNPQHQVFFYPQIHKLFLSS